MVRKTCRRRVSAAMRCRNIDTGYLREGGSSKSLERIELEVRGQGSGLVKDDVDYTNRQIDRSYSKRSKRRYGAKHIETGTEKKKILEIDLTDPNLTKKTTIT